MMELTILVAIVVLVVAFNWATKGTPFGKGSC